MRPVADDPGFAEAHQHRADVLVLVLDRSLSAADPVLERPPVRCLAERLAREFLREHGEVVRDDRVVLVVLPVSRRHCATLARTAHPVTVPVPGRTNRGSRGWEIISRGPQAGRSMPVPTGRMQARTARLSGAFAPPQESGLPGLVYRGMYRALYR